MAPSRFLCVDQTGLELKDLSASFSQVPGVKACTTSTQENPIFYKRSDCTYHPIADLAIDGLCTMPYSRKGSCLSQEVRVTTESTLSAGLSPAATLR